MRIGVLLLALLLGCSRGHHSTKRTYERPLIVSPVAYRIGGAPLRDPLIDVVLTYIDVRATNAELEAGASAPSQVPPASIDDPRIAAPVNALVDELERWAAARNDDERTASASALRAAARALDETFVRFGLAYHVHAEPRSAAAGGINGLRPRVDVRSYRVENVGFVSHGANRHAVLEVRPLSGIMEPPSHRFGPIDDPTPAINLDVIDERVTRDLLPLLAPGSLYAIEDAWAGTPPGRTLVNVLGAKLGDELTTALGSDATGGADVARTLRARDRVIADEPVPDRAKFANVGLFSFTGIADPVVSDPVRRELDRLDHELARLEAPRIRSRVTSLAAAIAERHALQHALDRARATPLRYPPALAVLVPEAAALGPLARDELSAYVAQLAADSALPHYALWVLASAALVQRVGGRPEWPVAIVVAEALAKQLHIASQPLVVDGTLDRDRYMVLVAAILERPGAELASAATASYLDLFGVAVE